MPFDMQPEYIYLLMKLKI